MKPKFTISIAVHDQLDITRKCLESILVHSPLDLLQILIFDNGSTADTGAYLCQLKHEYSCIDVNTSESNLGFGFAHNKNLEWATGDYFVVLNNDLEVCEQWLETIYQPFLDDPKIGITGPYTGCGRLGNNGMGYGRPDDDLEEMDYIEGSCLMIPTWLAQREGLFDPSFRFAYCEDADLSLRLREKGWKIKTVTLPMVHVRGSTSKAVVREGVDLQGYHLYNHAVFMTRWGAYLVDRSFAYKILIRRMAAAGDVLLITPIMKALKQKWADCLIDVVTSQAQVLEGNPQVHAAYGNMPEDLTVYDAIYDLDLAYEKKPLIPILDAYASVCDVVLEDRLPQIYLTAEHRQWAQFLKDGPWVVFHVGPTAWPGRNLPLATFDVVAYLLRKQGWKTCLVGLGGGSLLECNLDLRGKTSFLQLAAIIEASNLFVGLDSMPMHIATAFNKPTVGIFGCIDPTLRLPVKSYFKGVVSKTVGCVGCHHIQPAPVTFSSCLRGAPRCMHTISPAQILATIDEVLKMHQKEVQ